ncbi:MAG: hypothetical protein J0L70_17400 [Leptolyngbya sp. UWPOB_LEPTO1]|uniref:hypothetical protein n=1 Tax=Leptolyngbya sp. UWPOB_LEPTO1 TaxID=2815653 RepID=UPI001AC49410|nr:hypothetical protein [Leptolyngbya sp. UWPOB_LEPTO1]MBN8562309.1 hypothetical protein [Leptolyngbya sp. UWPOB_LEPTO1]
MSVLPQGFCLLQVVAVASSVSIARSTPVLAISSSYFDRSERRRKELKHRRKDSARLL